jgi:Mg/Co/Ni transporter MgtE
MTITSKVDISSLTFLNAVDKLRSATDDRLPKIVNETSNADIARSFDVLHDNVCFKVLELLDSDRLISVLSLLPDYSLTNVLSWKNNKILIYILTALSMNNDSKLLYRVLSVLDAETTASVFSNLGDITLSRILTELISSDVLDRLLVNQINSTISALISCNRLLSTFEGMAGESLAEIFPLISNSTLDKVMPLMSKGMLYRIFSQLDNINLGYILSRVNILSVVRVLL